MVCSGNFHIGVEYAAAFYGKIELNPFDGCDTELWYGVILFSVIAKMDSTGVMG